MTMLLLLNDQQDNHNAVPPMQVGSAAVSQDGFLDFGTVTTPRQQEGDDARRLTKFVHLAPRRVDDTDPC